MIENFGPKLINKIASFIGSWNFILIQSFIITVWVILNTLGIFQFDIYPFILLNLFLSFQAAYSTPLLLMAANKQSEKDREHMSYYLEMEKETNEMMKDLTKIITKIDQDIKLNKEALEDNDTLLAEIKIIREELKNLPLLKS